MEEKKKQESDKKEQQKQQYFAAQKQQLRTAKAKEMLGESAIGKARLGMPETKHQRQATMGQMRVHDQILGGDPLHPPGW